jgi:hypothetical protein
MNAPLVRLGLPLLSLSLLLAACGGGGTVNPPPTGTPVISLADSGPGTLRELLDSAVAGDTLRLDSGTITLAGPLKVTKSVTLNLGRGVINANGKGRALEVASGVTVTIKGGTLKGGTGAPITASGVGPQGLTVATYGGVLLNEGRLTLDGTAITGGTANLGGGIANLKGGTLILKGTVNVSGNTAQVLPAGATESSGRGGGLFNAGALRMEGGAVNSNSAFYAGGGIYAVKTATMTIQGGNIDNNTCTYSLTVQEKTTEGCAGGGIYTSSGFTLSGGTVRGNTSTLQGGGVYVVSSSDSAGTITGSTITMSGGEISGNTTLNAGGGILLGQAVTMNLSGGSILNNKVTDTGNAGGGGILAYKATLKMSGGTIGGNSAVTGGGIDAYTDNTVEISGGTIENNRTIANGNGGGINVNNGSTLNFTGGAIRNNTAAQDGGGTAISNSAGVLTMSGTASISGNKARWGGGIIVNGAKMTLSGGTISGNTATQTGGGLLDNGTIVMTGGEISANTVSNASPEGLNADGGGGVRLFAGSTFTASGGTIKNNVAPFGGGVKTDEIFQTTPASQFTLAGATISGNTATLYVGGGIYNKGKLTVQSGNVTGNTAKTQGGGIFNVKVATYAQPGGSVTGNTPDNVFNEQ